MFIYQKITDLIIEKLESGVVPWHKTWKNSYPKNLVSGQYYKGINIMLLGLQNFESNYWLTFKQCKDLGGYVKKDEKSSFVVFWKPMINFDDNTIEETSNIKFNYLLRYYSLFNIEQCDLPDEVKEKYHISDTNNKILEAEEIISNYPSPPEISINNLIPNPRYFPKLDKIEIQSIDNFHSNDDYYASLYHELIHSTGAEFRLARNGIVDKINFGSENYSKEELVAEIGASYLCNISGINRAFDNQTSYIQNWLKVLDNDNRMVLIAASQAQKATDFILNKHHKNEYD
jgi:antirestriction protein ArdC